MRTTPLLRAAAEQLFGRRAGNRLRQIEQRMILALAEILGLKKLGQADHLRAASGGVGDAAQRLFEILFRLRAARHLYQRHAKFLRGHAFPTSANKYSRRAVSYQPSAGRNPDGKTGALRSSNIRSNVKASVKRVTAI